MAETGEVATGLINGGKVHQERARRALRGTCSLGGCPPRWTRRSALGALRCPGSPPGSRARRSARRNGTGVALLRSHPANMATPITSPSPSKGHR